MTATAPVLLHLLAADSADPFLLVGGTALGLWAVYNGVQTWRGRELRSIVRHAERSGDPDAARRWVFGGRRVYQSFLGAGLSGIPTGLGFLLILAGVTVRDALDRPEDWGPWYATAILATVLLGVGFLYSVAYFWTGVPDRLRPPSQRGQLQPDDPHGDKRARGQRIWRAVKHQGGSKE